MATKEVQETLDLMNQLEKKLVNKMGPAMYAAWMAMPRQDRFKIVYNAMIDALKATTK